MAKYDKMNETNRQESIRKIECAIEGIHRASSEGKVLSASELSQNTGLPKGLFYKNEEVKLELNKEKEKIDQDKLAQIRWNGSDRGIWRNQSRKPGGGAGKGNSVCGGRRFV